MAQQQDDLYRELFSVRRSIRYHQRRLAFYERLNTIASAIQVIAGGAAFALAAANSPASAAWFAAIVALVGTIDLTVGSARKVRAHADFSRRFSQLEREMASHEGEELPRPQLMALRQQRLVIQEEEPPLHQVVVLDCHNELVRSSYPSGVIYPVRPWQRYAGNFVHMNVGEIMRAGTAWTAIDIRPHPPGGSLTSPPEYWTAGVLARMDVEQRPPPPMGSASSMVAARNGHAPSKDLTFEDWFSLPVMGMAVSATALVIAIVTAVRA
jgi:hypothetical protein